MKTTILLSCFVIFYASRLHAQIDEGKVQIGGDLGFDDVHFNQGNSTNYADFTLHPSIGRFYATNKLAGLFLNFNYYNSHGGITYEYGGGVYFRQYKQIVKALYVFAEEQGGFIYNWYKITSPNPSSSSSYSISASLRPGIAYDLTRRMQLEMAYNNLLSVSYNYTKGSELFSLNSNLEGSAFQNLLVGFRFYLK